MNRAVALVSLLMAVVLSAPRLEAQNPTEIVRAAWDHWRGESSVSEMTMVIHRPSWERSMSMSAWTRGSKHSLVRVTAPSKDAGNGTLMVDNARIIKAEGELAATEKLEKAAMVIQKNPSILELRRMQMVSEVGMEKNTTTIVLMPSEFVSMAKGIGQLAQTLKA